MCPSAATRPKDPRLTLKLLVYGYATGTVSSRKLERATYRDVAVRMLVADLLPIRCAPSTRSLGR